MKSVKRFAKHQHFAYIPRSSITLRRSLRFWFSFFQSSLTKYKVRLVLFLIVLVLGILTIKNLVPILPIFRNNLVIGVVGEYTIANLPQSLTQLYSAGLTKFDKTGQVLPNLAKSWETQDAKKFKFILQDNLYWQDGKKLTANDIQFQLPNVEIKVLDAKTIEFTLKDTFSPFPQVLAKPVFRGSTQISTGNYRLGKIVKSGETLKQIDLIPTKKDLPKLIIRFFANSQTATSAFKTGQITVIFNLMRTNGLENWKGIEVIQTIDPTRLVAVFYNTKDELLKDERVRRALDISIDRSKLKNATTVPYPPNSWVAADFKSVFDLQKATALLRDEKKTSGGITILTPTIFENIAADIAKNWQGLGFDVQISKIDKIPDNFQVAIFGLEIPVDPDQYSLWHSSQSQSLTGIENPKLDKLLEDGRKIIDLNERKIVYQDLQKELKEQVPASFLFFPDRIIVINKNSEKKLDQIKKLFPEFPVN